MNPRRSATVALALCGTLGLAGWIVAWLAGFGSAGIENTGAVIEDNAASLTANAELAGPPQATAMGNAAVAGAEVATAAEPAADASGTAAESAGAPGVLELTAASGIASGTVAPGVFPPT